MLDFILIVLCCATRELFGKLLGCALTVGAPLELALGTMLEIILSDIFALGELLCELLGHSLTAGAALGPALGVLLEEAPGTALNRNCCSVNCLVIHSLLELCSA
jgi:hypothetical protein